MKQIMPSFSESLRATFVVLEHSLLSFVVVVAVPLMLSYVLFLISLGLLLNDVQSTQTLAEFTALFSWKNPTVYFVILGLLISFLNNIIGLIGAPLVAMDNGNSNIRTIFPRTLRFVGAFLSFLLLSLVLLLIVMVISHVIIAIILLIAGLINLTWIDLIDPIVETYVPSLFLALASLFLIFVPFLIIERGGYPWKAFRTSVNLVWQNFTSIFIREIIIVTLVSLLTYLMQVIPFIGTPLAILFSTIIITSYNYVIFRSLTHD